MNIGLALGLMACGLMLAGLGYLVHRIEPALGQPAAITGWIGGALCGVWGLRAALGNRRKVWAIVTLIPVSYILLSQTVLTWTASRAEAPAAGAAAVVIGAMFVLSVGMLMTIAYAGAFAGEALRPGARAGSAAKPTAVTKEAPAGMPGRVESARR